MLSDLQEEKLKNAIKKFCLSHKEIYPGTNLIAYIREYALELDEIPSAGEAWGYAHKKICGSVFTNSEFGLADKTAELMGGYAVLGRSENSDVLRGQFVKLYNELLEKEKTNRLMGL